MTIRIIVGNCLDELRKLEAESVHCAVSSPPYWGLRDYGVDPNVWGGEADCEHEFVDETIERQIRKGMGLEELGKRYRGGGQKHGRIAKKFEFKRGDCIHCGAWRGVFGLEPTPDMFIEHLVAIFEEVRRVLRDDGTLWLNLGDSYATGAGKVGERPGGGKQGDVWAAGAGTKGSTSWAGPRGKKADSAVGPRQGHEGKHRYADGNAVGPMTQPNRMPQEGLKPKDLVGIPWMAAFALRKAGWYLRMDNIWHKPNPMPESIEDRPTKSHEYLFLLSKSEFYFYDHEAIKEEASDNSHPRKAANGKSTTGRTPAVSPKSADHGLGIKANESFHAAGGDLVSKRNKRSVWTVATQPFPEAHFATFPPALIKPCVMAGTSERGCCSSCHAPFERITAPTERYASVLGQSYHDHGSDGSVGMMQMRGSNRQNAARDDAGTAFKETELVGWYPTCACEGLEQLPAYPRSPQDKSDDEKAKWRAACAAVTAKRRLLCEPAAKLKTIPAVVLDPFGGAGTTGLVADRLQRDALLVELNPQYAIIAEKRLRAEGGMLTTVVIDNIAQEAAE